MYGNVTLSNIFGQSHTASQIVSHKDTIYSVVHNYIKVYDVGRKLSKCMKYEAMHNVRDIQISMDGRFIVTIDSNGYLQVIITETGTLLMHHPFGGRWERCAINKSGNCIAVAYAGTVNMYYIDPDAALKGNHEEPILLKSFSGLRDIIKLQFSPETEYLVIVSIGGQITIKIVGFSIVLRQLKKEGFIEKERACTTSSKFSQVINSQAAINTNQTQQSKVPYLKQLQQMFPQQEFTLQTNDVVDVYFINPLFDIEKQKPISEQIEDDNISVQEKQNIIQNHQQKTFCNVFDTQIVKNLLTFTLQDEDIQLINKQVDSGTLAGYSILVVTSNGLIQVFTPGHPQNNFDEDFDGQPFFWHRSEQFKVSLSSGEVEELDSYENKNLVITSCSCDISYQQLCVGTSDGSYILYSLPDIAFMHSVSVSAYPITSICIPSRHQIAVASIYERQIAVFDHRVEAFEVVEPSHTVLCIALSPDGSLLACGSSNGEILIFNAVSDLLELRYEAHAGPVRDIHFLPTSRSVASCGVDGVMLYDLNKKILFRKMQTETNMFVKVAVEIGGEILAAADENNEVLLFDTHTGKLIGTAGRHEGPITALIFSQPGILVSGSWDKTVQIYNVFLGSPPTSIAETAEITALSVDFTTGRLCVATADGGLSFYDLNNENDVESQIAYHSIKKYQENNKIFKSKHTQTFSALSYYKNIVFGSGNSKFVSVINSNQEGGELQKNIQISINHDFAGIDIDDIWTAGKQGGKKRIINNYEAVLLKQTREADLRTRKVLDPILALENKKLEARTIQIAVSQVSDVIYVLTTFGILQFSSSVFSNTTALSAKIDFQGLQKKIFSPQYNLTYDDLIDACIINDEKLIKRAFQLFKRDQIQINETNAQIVFLKTVNQHFPSNQAIFDEVINIAKQLAKQVGAKTKRQFNYTEMSIYIELMRFQTLYINFLRNNGQDLFKQLECSKQALTLFELPDIDLNQAQQQIIQKKLDKHNQFYEKQIGTGGLPQHKRRKGRIAMDKALQDIKQLQ